MFGLLLPKTSENFVQSTYTLEFTNTFSFRTHSETLQKTSLNSLVLFHEVLTKKPIIVTFSSCFFFNPVEVTKIQILQIGKLDIVNETECL